MRDLLTANEVAKACRVSRNTVVKWFDTGRLKGWRVPGSRHRRIPRAELVAFLERNGMPAGWADQTAGG